MRRAKKSQVEPKGGGTGGVSEFVADYRFRFFQVLIYFPFRFVSLTVSLTVSFIIHSGINMSLISYLFPPSAVYIVTLMAYFTARGRLALLSARLFLMNVADVSS